MRRSFVAIVALLALLFPMTGALALETHGDANDVNGRLDLKEALYGRPLMEQARLTVKTYNRWRCRYLAPTRDTNIGWLFDGGNDGDFDMVGNFFCRNGKLKFRMKSLTGDAVNDVFAASKPSPRSARTQITLGYPQLTGGTKLGLVVRSRDGEAAGCATPCTDRIPDAGKWVVNR